MAQILELAHLGNQHCVTEMQIRCSGVETGLHAQSLTRREALAKFILQ